MALILGAFSALVTLAVVLFNFVMNLLMVAGVVAVRAKGAIDEMDEKAGNVFLKTSSPQDHRRIIEMLYADFKVGFTQRNSTYHVVGRSSTSSKLFEKYNALPQEAKDDIREIWGKHEMLVSTANLKNIFGVRKLD